MCMCRAITMFPFLVPGLCLAFVMGNFVNLPSTVLAPFSLRSQIQGAAAAFREKAKVCETAQILFCKTMHHGGLSHHCVVLCLLP